MDPPPAAIPYHARSVGWNTSSEHGCNTDTCHCSWYGVTCDNTGLVVRLELQANGLAGTLPDSIGGLIHLQVLDLGNNTISGTLPFGMAGPVQKHGGRPGFEQIQHINLGANMISGSVPDTFNN